MADEEIEGAEVPTPAKKGPKKRQSLKESLAAFREQPPLTQAGMALGTVTNAYFLLSMLADVFGMYKAHKANRLEEQQQQYQQAQMMQQPGQAPQTMAQMGFQQPQYPMPGQPGQGY